MRPDTRLPFGDAHRSNSTHRYLPIMIGRLMLSLKKAGETPGVGWSAVTMTNPQNPGGQMSKRSHNIPYAPAYEDGTVSSTEDDIPLALMPSHVARGYT